MGKSLFVNQSVITTKKNFFSALQRSGEVQGYQSNVKKHMDIKNLPAKKQKPKSFLRLHPLQSYLSPASLLSVVGRLHQKMWHHQRALLHHSQGAWVTHETTLPPVLMVSSYTPRPNPCRAGLPRSFLPATLAYLGMKWSPEKRTSRRLY